MQRKKISTGVNNAAAIIDLDENEDLVEEVTTTKRVGRQRRERAADPPPPPEFIDVDESDDDEDDEREDTPEFSDTSLAALIYSGGEERVENQYCTIAIRRNPDSMNDRFLNPCGANTNLPPLRNVELTADRMDIEERVRAEFGGGHYFFQIHFDNRLRSSWKSTLSDDPAAVHAAKIATATPPAAAVAAAASNPIDSFLDSLEKQKRMQDLLFGDDKRKLEAEIAELRAANAAAKAEPSEPRSERLVMLEQALNTPNADLQGRLINHLFPSDEEGSRHWSADLFAVALDNKETLLALAGSLLGPLLGGGVPAPAQQPQSFEDMMRQPTPATIPAPTPRFAFGQRTPPPSDPPEDTPEIGTPWTPPENQEEESPDVPIEAFINQPEPLPLTSEGIDQTTDAAAIDAEEVETPAVEAVKKRRGAAK